MAKFKSGFISIIGRPNVGKSTLLNTLIGKKIAIMSDKPQTTRNEVLGILTTEEYQLVFIDTPGIHKPRTNLGEYMMDMVKKNLKNIDLILYIVDSSQEIGKGEEFIIDMLSRTKTPVILVINKIDLDNKEQVLPIIEKYNQLIKVENIIPISALKNQNIDELIEKILENIGEGPMYFPADETSNLSEAFIVSEIIREKILRLTEEEVPHSSAVLIDLIEEEGDLINVYASIYVERKSQKGIIIGKGASMLKKIGRLSRIELERIWGMKVYLNLQVKVKDSWRKKDFDMRNFGYKREK